VKELGIEDRPIFDDYIKTAQLDSFYHYFPLLCGISYTNVNPDTGVTNTFRWEVKDGHLWVWDGKNLFYPPIGERRIVPNVDKVQVSLTKAPRPFKTAIFDVNYIYNLSETLSVKNFRHNVKRFKRDHKDVKYAPAETKEAYHIIKTWYTNKVGDFADFGYTLWLSLNFVVFDDIRARVVYIDGLPSAFTLWGELNEDTAIHVICKDLGIPFLQDYTRYMTYQEMLEEGFKWVNDGSDVGIHGLRVYKLKLRPRYIIPIYSWIRVR